MGCAENSVSLVLQSVLLRNSANAFVEMLSDGDERSDGVRLPMVILTDRVWQLGSASSGWRAGVLSFRRLMLGRN
jgi:hypothetical protein